MGASPKTKSDYRREIALKQGQIASLRASKSAATNQALKNTYSRSIASLQGEIASLKAKMAGAPNK